MNDTVFGNNVFFQNHFDSVHRQAVAIAADLDGISLQGLIRGSSHDGLRALDRVQEMEIQKS